VFVTFHAHRFGAHRHVYMRRTSVSIDMYASHLDSIVNKRTGKCLLFLTLSALPVTDWYATRGSPRPAGSRDVTTILHACGLDDWRQYAVWRTGGLVPYPPYFKFKVGGGGGAVSQVETRVESNRFQRLKLKHDELLSISNTRRARCFQPSL